MYALSKSSSVFLDVFRTAFSQFVLLGHMLGLMGIQQSAFGTKLPEIQSLAVTALFLLSGFLTVYSAERKAKRDMSYSFPQFFVSRFVRIYAVLIPSLIFVWGIDSLHAFLAPEQYVYAAALNPKTFLANLLMLQDFPPFIDTQWLCTSFGSARPLWTLPIEWFLYMVFGVVFFKAYRQKPQYKSVLPCLLFLFSIIVVGYNFFGGRGNGLSFTWLFGVVLYFLLCEKPDISQKTAAVGFFVALLLAYKRSVEVYRAFGIAYDPLFSVLLGLSLYFGICLTRDVQWGGFIVRASKFFSGYSFSLYVTHYSLLVLLQSLFFGKMRGWQLALLEFLLCNAVACLFALVFERKIPKVIFARLEKRRGKAGI